MFKKIIFLAILAFVSCKKTEKPAQENTKAVVVSARIEASKIGIEILKKGGNAFDAMIATEFALAVAYPYAGNLGGGGFMVYRKANGEIGSLDYREKAPKAAHPGLFLDENGNVIPDKSLHSGVAVGIPGTVAGMLSVHEKMGSLPLKTILEPVIALAERGVIVTQKQQERLAKYRAKIIEMNGSNSFWATEFKVNDTIKYPQLAATLRKIVKTGKHDFYEGESAQKLIDFIQSKNGIMTLEDLKSYEPKWREPIVFNYKELKIISMGPPSSGGMTLAQILKMIEPYQIDSLKHNSVAYMQVLVEAERRAYTDRNFYLGDPDFVEIPMQKLLDPNYLKQRMADFSFEKASVSSAIKPGLSFSESTETTHYSIVDALGNAISATTTLNDAFGSKYYVESLGFFLNNQMDDFSSKPGVPNSYGLVGAEANKIEPEKRMLSSMTPTIVEKNGQLWLVLGSPGGSTIITSVLQTILNAYEFDMPIEQAVASPRFHHQALPNEIVLEPNGFSHKTKQELIAKGYFLVEKETRVIGKVNAILVDSKKGLQAGPDPRGDEAAASY
uniref:gamma-glutamyltransferase n=1 Tax=Flavobacterium sp. TaxID=239 RepID=UPI00404AF93A